MKYPLNDFFPTQNADAAGDDSLVLLVKNGHILLPVEDEMSVLAEPGQPLNSLFWSKTKLKFSPVNALDSHESRRHFLGYYRGQGCYCWEVPEELTDMMDLLPHQPAGLRSLLGQVSDDWFNIAGRAVQISTWFQQHRYCGACGRPTEYMPGERATRCQHCDLNFFPRIAPCVIMLVTREDQCLLARNTSWERYFFSALAGFIEPGESVESALMREVYEETRIEVGDITYFGSQPWPFPGQLMIGFHADYKSGDIQVDGEEIAEAHWWSYDQLPPCPDTRSLSGQLIQSFVDRFQ